MHFFISLGLIFLHMTLTASLVGLVMLLIQFLLQKLPKKYTCFLWLTVLFRMVCPVSFSTGISILEPAVKTGWIVPLFPETNSPSPIGAVLTIPITLPDRTIIQILLFAIVIVWLSGIFLFLFLNFVPYIRLKKQMQDDSQLLEDSFYLSNRLSSPLILGFFHPRIYLPSGLTLEDQRLQKLHARQHLRRGDFFLKPFWFIITVIHWYNPLAWLFYYQMLNDLEQACDEMTLDQLAKTEQKSYLSFLHSLASTQNNQFSNCYPLAIGETRSEKRITHLTEYQKLSRIGIGLSLIIVCILLIIFISNPLAI